MKSNNDYIAIRINSFVATWAIHELYKIDPKMAEHILRTANQKYFGDPIAQDRQIPKGEAEAARAARETLQKG